MQETCEQFVKNLYPEAECEFVPLTRLWVVTIPSLGLRFSALRKRWAWTEAKRYFKPLKPQPVYEQPQAWESLCEWF